MRPNPLPSQSSRELDRAIETRENANAVSVRVEFENRRLREALGRLVECVEEDDRFSPKTSNALTAAREIIR